MTTETEKTFDTSKDLRIYKRDGGWLWCFADDYSEGPFADGDDMGPFDTLPECLQHINARALRINK